MQEETVNVGSVDVAAPGCMYASGVAPPLPPTTMAGVVCVKRRKLRGEQEEDGSEGRDIGTTATFGTGLRVWPPGLVWSADMPCAENYYSLAGIRLLAASENERMKLTHAVWGRANFVNTGSEAIYAGKDVFWGWPRRDGGAIRTMSWSEFKEAREAATALWRRMIAVSHADLLDPTVDTSRLAQQAAEHLNGNIRGVGTLAMQDAAQAAATQSNVYAGNIPHNNNLSVYLAAVAVRVRDAADAELGGYPGHPEITADQARAAARDGLLAAVRRGIDDRLAAERARLAGVPLPAEHIVYMQMVLGRVYIVAHNARGTAENRLVDDLDFIDAYAGHLEQRRATCTNVAAGYLATFNGLLNGAGVAPVEDAAGAGAVRRRLAEIVAMLDSHVYVKRHYLGRCMLGAEPGGTGAVLLGI